MARDAQVFKYESPDQEFDEGRKVATLCQTDRIVCCVQTIRKGGETREHSHSHLDGVWMVLSGRARFYAADNQLIGEFGKYEGVLIPRDFKYWFETASEDEALELMQIEASDVPLEKFFSGTAKNIVDRIDSVVRTIPG